MSQGAGSGAGLLGGVARRGLRGCALWQCCRRGERDAMAGPAWMSKVSAGRTGGDRVNQAGPTGRRPCGLWAARAPTAASEGDGVKVEGGAALLPEAPQAEAQAPRRAGRSEAGLAPFRRPGLPASARGPPARGGRGPVADLRPLPARTCTPTPRAALAVVSPPKDTGALHRELTPEPPEGEASSSCTSLVRICHLESSCF